MRFHKHVNIEEQVLLKEQLKEYERNITMTKEERKALYKWVASGRSPYDNGDYVYGSNGFPLDFISALRSEAELQEWFENLTEEERCQETGYAHVDYDTELDTPVIYVNTYDIPLNEDEDLPFR